MWSTPPLSRCSWIRADPWVAPFRAAIDAGSATSCREQTAALGDLQPEIGPLLALTSRLLAGGKRLRPAFCAWGYVAAAGLEDDEARLDGVLAAAASLELLHVSALVHDDVMDGSDIRRGDPSAHRQFEACIWRTGGSAIPRPSAGPARSCSATCW